MNKIKSYVKVFQSGSQKNTYFKVWVCIFLVSNKGMNLYKCLLAICHFFLCAMTLHILCIFLLDHSCFLYYCVETLNMFWLLTSSLYIYIYIYIYIYSFKNLHSHCFQRYLWYLWLYRNFSLHVVKPVNLCCYVFWVLCIVGKMLLGYILEVHFAQAFWKGTLAVFIFHTENSLLWNNCTHLTR